MPPRSYKCPHCGEIQKAEPAADQKVSVTCAKCGGRFRIPAMQDKQRVLTSMASAAVREEVRAQAEAYRSEDDKQKLQRIIDERRLGDYDILDELGRGGMGVVFKAFHRHLKRIVALKVILPDADDAETLLKRFRREAELHARLSHANIVHVYDYGVIDGMHYFAMDFITGISLTKLIGSPELRLAQRVRIIEDVADALEHAHGQGVVHRDIKPDNVIVDAGWAPHVVDFGIAKATDSSGQENITRQGLAVGTPHYMAPEQFRPKLGAVGPQSDVYAVGAMLYHLVSGKTPFEAESAHQVLIKAATQEAAPLVGTKTPSDEVIDADLAAIIRLAMVKEPIKRYPASSDLRDDLRRWAAGEEVKANPLSGKQRLRRRLDKNAELVVLAGTAVAVFLAAVVALVSTALVVRGREVALEHDIVAARNALLSGSPESAHGPLTAVQSELASGTSSAWIGLGVVGAVTLIALALGWRRLSRKKPVGIEPTLRPDEIGETAVEVQSHTNARSRATDR